MTGLILKLVLIILVLRALLRLFRGIAAGLRGSSTTPTSVALARDPICGTFVAPSTAPSFANAGQMHFFCSEKCRRAYQAKFAR